MVKPGPAGRQAFSAGPDDYSVPLVLLEGFLPIVGQTVESFLGSALAAHDEGIHTLVHLLEQRRILGRGPEVLDHQHALIEGFVVRRGFTELLRAQHLLVAGVAAQFGPARLHVFAHEPLAELQALLTFLRITHTPYPLP